jgi:hypothetical protein
MTTQNDLLHRLDALFDPHEQMVQQPVSTVGYHTALRSGEAHGTRESLHYAVALLDAGRTERAAAILARVIALQDQNPASPTYGIWSWYLSEPLANMAPPDWNWADFCGTQLLQVLIDHRAVLPAKLIEQIEAAVVHAARSIQRRDVTLHYTNIALMGAYVTLVAGERLADAALREYGLARLRRFHQYTREHGGFGEYNSPSYTPLALEMVALLRQHVLDASAHSLIDWLYHRVWEEIAVHYHPPTGQWAGPHSRNYRTLLSRDALQFKERRTPMPCPVDLEHYLAKLDQPREVVTTFRGSGLPVVTTTYLHPDFALGSVNSGDLWNQRRSLIAYWGTVENPGYLRVRFLRDGHDFATVQFYSQQHQGAVLAAVNFATDGGLTHLHFDRMTDGTFSARDLRLRFELGGSAAAATVKLAGNTAAIESAVTIHLGIAHAQLGELAGRLTTGRDQNTAFVDVVFYEGGERRFDLRAMQTAVSGFALRLNGARPLPAARLEAQQLRLDWEGLSLAVAARPDTLERLHQP